MTEFVVTTTDDENLNGGNADAESQDGNGLSFREAVGLAHNGDTITFADTLAGSDFHFDYIAIEDSVTIDGDLDNDGTPDITFFGNGLGEVIDVTREGLAVTFDGLTFTGAGAIDIGAIVGSSHVVLTVKNSVFTGNAGGALYVTGDGPSLTIEGTSIHDNGNASPVFVSGTTTEGATLSITDSSILGSTMDVADISFQNGTLTIDNSTIAFGYEGIVAARATVDISNTTITGHRYQDILTAQATVTMSNSVIASGDAVPSINSLSSSYTFTGTNILATSLAGTAGDAPTVTANLDDIFTGLDTINGAVGGLLSETATATGGIVKVAATTGSAAGVGAFGLANTPAVIGGNTDGSIGEDDTGTVTGHLTITDADGVTQESFNADTVAGSYGGLTLSANGDWSYDLTESNSDVQALGASGTLTDTLTVHSADGTAQDIVITIDGANDAPVFGGTLTGTTSEDDTGTITAFAMAQDPDQGQDGFTAETVHGTYGDLIMTPSGLSYGSWSYDLNESNADVQGLLSGETLTDTLTVHSADGTAQDIVITITGVDDAPSLWNLDDLAVTEGDGPMVIDDSVTFFDADQDFAGAVLKVSGLLAEDTVSVNNVGTGTGQVGFDGSHVSYEGVTIGTVSGGEGAALSVTFNANASNDAIDALLQNLTYDNSSDEPTASRTLSYDFTDAAGNAVPTGLVFKQVTGSGNPLGAVDLGSGHLNVTSFVDIDNDGDLDAFIGDTYGALHFLRNDGTADSPSFTEVTGADNPLVANQDYYYSTPVFADLDHDGDFDALVGDSDGAIHYFRNDGTAETPSFTKVAGSDNPAAIVAGPGSAIPTLVDIDGDGDLDLFVGDRDGNISFYRNDGTASNPSFTAVTGSGNPFDGVDVGRFAAPAFVDMDGDGDMDAVVGDLNGTLSYFENTGTSNSPQFTLVSGTGNPFNGVDVGAVALPVFVDINNDGRQDAFVSDTYGHDYYFQSSFPNLLTVTVAAANDAATFGGELSATIAEDADTIAGVATVADVDSAASFNTDTLAGTYGSLTIGANGDWVYTLDSANADIQALGVGDTLGDAITVHSADGTAQDITITIEGSNDIPSFDGDLTGHIDADGDTVGGSATVSDADSGQSSFSADTINGMYGSLALDANGDWMYTLDSGNADVQALDDGDSLTDIFTVTSADGTGQDISVTIDGANDAPTSTGGSIMATEHQAAGFSVAAFGFSDMDAGDTLVSVRIDSLPAAGVLALDGTAVAAGDEIALSDIGGLTYTPAINDNMARSFSFSVSDGDAWSPSAIMAIDVSTVNDPPTGPVLTSNGVTENEAGAFVGTLSSRDPEGGTVSYGVDNDNRFRVVGNQLYLRDGVSLDYESGATVTIHVHATDDAGLNGASIVSFDVINVVEGTSQTGGNGNDTLLGNSGDDTLTGGGGNDTLDGGAGNDIIEKDNSDQGQDVIVGGDGGDEISAGGGNDFVVGDGATDGTIRQSLIENGDTSVDGADTIHGGDGNDTLLGGGWNDDLVNDNGTYDDGEEVSSGTAPNRMWAGAGNDVAVGSGGDDKIGGNTDDDYLKGLGGNDTLFGNMGNDTLLGGNGDDLLFGGEGDDTVDGGAGADTLWAGAGDDTLTGGAGTDIFIFGIRSGNDIITDFNTDADSLDLSARGINDQTALVDATTEATQDGQTGLLIDLGGGETVFLAGLRIEDVGGIDLVH